VRDMLTGTGSSTWYTRQVTRCRYAYREKAT
jgi:hypothetical protein